LSNKQKHDLSLGTKKRGERRASTWGTLEPAKKASRIATSIMDGAKKGVKHRTATKKIREDRIHGKERASTGLPDVRNTARSKSADFIECCYNESF